MYGDEMRVVAGFLAFLLLGSFIGFGDVFYFFGLALLMGAIATLLNIAAGK